MSGGPRASRLSWALAERTAAGSIHGSTQRRRRHWPGTHLLRGEDGRNIQPVINFRSLCSLSCVKFCQIYYLLLTVILLCFKQVQPKMLIS